MIKKSSIGQLAILFLAFSIAAFAQAGPFSAAAQGASTETITAVKYVAIIIAAVSGIGLMAGEGRAIMKVTGLIFGATFALFATPIVTWVQSL